MPLSAIPYYLLGLILIFVFAFGLKIFPLGSAYSTGATIELTWRFALDVLRHGILPSLSIVLSVIGFWMLGMRGMMVTNMGEDYMIMAEAKGLSPMRIFFRYAMRNAMLPQVTGLGVDVRRGSSPERSWLKSSSTIPAWAGFLWFAIRNTDYFLIQGIVFVLVVTVALAMLILDLVYPLIDRRIVYGRG